MDNDLFALIVLDQLIDAGGTASAPYYDLRWQKALDKMQADGLVNMGMKTRHFFKDSTRDGMYVLLEITKQGRELSLSTRKAAV